MIKFKLWILNFVWGIWSHQFRVFHEKSIRAARKRNEIEGMIRSLEDELQEKDK